MASYPSAYVSTDTIPTVTGNTYTVNAGGDVQAAIDSAAAANGSLTHAVVLQAGATFTCASTLRLPVKSAGNGWIIIRTSSLAGIAAQNKRIVPASHAAAMPKLHLAGWPYGLETYAAANHYRFIGIEFIGIYDGYDQHTLVQIYNEQQSTLASIPTDIILDRCIARKTGPYNNKMVGLQAIRGAVIDSVVTNDTLGAGDSNAIWLFNSPGPMKVLNNRLQAYGEVVFHGSAGYVAALNPTDVEIRRNLFVGDSTGENHGKNLIEWKGGDRVWVAANIFQDDNSNGQYFSVAATPTASEQPDANWIRDLIIENNLFRNIKGWLYLSGGYYPYENYSGPIVIRNNYVADANYLDGYALQTGNGIHGTEIVHNTVRNGGSVGLKIITIDHYPHEDDFIMRDNILFAGDPYYWGVANMDNNGTWTGTEGLDLSIPDRVFSKNVLVGAQDTFTGTDLTGNYFPASISFAADGSLPGGSPYKNAATDETDIGANFTTLYGTTSGVGQYGAGVNDYYAYDGQWPTDWPTGTIVLSVR